MKEEFWWNKEPKDHSEDELKRYANDLDAKLKEEKQEGIESSLLGVCFKYKLIGLVKFQEDNSVSYKAYLKTLTSPEINEYPAIFDTEEKTFEIATEGINNPLVVQIDESQTFGLKVISD